MRLKTTNAYLTLAKNPLLNCGGFLFVNIYLLRSFLGLAVTSLANELRQATTCDYDLQKHLQFQNFPVRILRFNSKLSVCPRPSIQTTSITFPNPNQN